MVVFCIIVELLVVILLVVYGLWGIYVLIFMLCFMLVWLNEYFGFILLFSIELNGFGLVLVVLVLVIMILLIVVVIFVDVLWRIFYKFKEVVYGMGIICWEVIFKVVLLIVFFGILVVLVLVFGCVLGEIMVLVMLIGNSN